MSSMRIHGSFSSTLRSVTSPNTVSLHVSYHSKIHTFCYFLIIQNFQKYLNVFQHGRFERLSMINIYKSQKWENNVVSVISVSVDLNVWDYSTFYL